MPGLRVGRYLGTARSINLVSPNFIIIPDLKATKIRIPAVIVSDSSSSGFVSRFSLFPAFWPPRLFPRTGGSLPVWTMSLGVFEILISPPG